MKGSAKGWSPAHRGLGWECGTRGTLATFFSGTQGPCVLRGKLV